jgi:hypothetical protein
MQAHRRPSGHLRATAASTAERAHVADGGVHLQTHITDVLAAPSVERRTDDLALVGHSY